MAADRVVGNAAAPAAAPAASGAVVLEKPFFFERGTAQLFGMLHEPASAASRTAFVMSHPFGEEKLWSHRVFVSFARALAQRGHAVLRFDYMGAGDSSGTTADTSLETHLADLSAAVGTLVARFPGAERVGMVGLRLGASIAALLADQAVSGGRLAPLQGAPMILWDPIVDGENHFQELLRSNLGTQLAVFGKVLESREVLSERIRNGGTVNVDGYEIGRALFDSCARADLLPIVSRSYSGPVLVTQIAGTATPKIRDDLQALANSYRNGTFLRSTEQPFWREIKAFYGRAADLQKTTLEWLEQAHV